MTAGRTRWHLLLFVVTLFALCSLPESVAVSLRSATVGLVAPTGRGLLKLAGLWAETPSEVERLRLENGQLRDEVERLSAALERQPHDVKAVVARVVHRSPASWSSSLWIDVGKGSVERHSPVVVGNSVVGIVDQVGAYQSRVRLITDSGLHPSVRVLRGGRQDSGLLERIGALQEALRTRDDLLTAEARTILVDNLELLRGELCEEEAFLLAKGELEGSSAPLWRCSSNLLHGTGFNLDFADEAGPARDLRTGEAKGVEAVPILKAGDLLITTGMDGLFPAGLEVGRVVTVAPLQEGSYYYELEARPTAGDLNELETVFVLPPQ